MSNRARNFRRLLLSAALLPVMLRCAWLSGAELAAIRLSAAQQQAVKHIEMLGGVVSLCERDGDALEVDFRFATSPVTDGALVHVAALPSVAVLRLGGSAVTDAGLAHVAKLPMLRKLYLEKTAVTDAGLRTFAGLAELEYLNLYQTSVSDAGLEPVARSPKLQFLGVAETRASADGIARLQQQFAELRIVPDRREDRHRAELAVEVTRNLVAQAEQDLVVVEQDMIELAPRADELKKSAEASDKEAEAKRRQFEDFRNKTLLDLTRQLEARRREASEVQKRAASQPDDANLQRQASDKQRAVDETAPKFAAAEAQSDKLRAEADAAKERAVVARDLYDRGREAKKRLEIAKSRVAGAKQQQIDAQARLASLE